MNDAEIKKHTDGMTNNWSVPEERLIEWEPSLHEEEIKKTYCYFPQHVYLHALKKPIFGKYLFVVEYQPTGSKYGFERWTEANAFAKERKAHIAHSFALLGGW